ncbi:MAG: hypothetical protein JSR73_04025 [Proteobacteria bacterium]|nr:hypothetical protein [Pseudomonadota bacterium]
MVARDTEKVVVLTQAGCFPRPEEFDSDPNGALERLQVEALRVHAEALTCLSQMLGSIAGDCDFDSKRFAALLRRSEELRDLASSLQSPRPVTPEAPSTDALVVDRLAPSP